MLRNELSSPTSILTNLNNINIILGRNGAGKSKFLRSLDQHLGTNQDFYIRYVSPERAGTFSKVGHIVTGMSNDPNYLRNARGFNQSPDFKAASASLLSEAETTYLRKLSKTPEIRNDLRRNFETDRLDKINSLLTNISIEAGKYNFQFKSLEGELIQPGDISSGEAEAVSLATEILYFFDTVDPEKFNVLLLDEPDVHLHPDLQARLAKLIVTMFDEYADSKDMISVCISTHSAPFVCAIADSNYTSIGTKGFGVGTVVLKAASVQLRKIGPFFGHPLSLTLSEDLPLIVEGEDDERVWQQAGRSSNGQIKVFPVLAVSVEQQFQLEDFSKGILNAIYDDPIAFSIRDGDGKINEPLHHLPPVRRFRLNCYSIENLLTTDECMAVMATTWENFVIMGRTWLEQNPNHEDTLKISALFDDNKRLRHTKIKDIRQLICSIACVKKPWEVVVGQALGAVKNNASAGNNMLVDFVGEEAIKAVIFREF